MSFTLTDADETDFKVNAWNWGVLHYLVESAGLFPDEIWEPVRYNCGTPLDSEQVILLAGFLEAEVLPKMKPGDRMFFDGSITDEPDDGTFYREESEMWRNYSLHHSVLTKIIEFLRTARAPVGVY